jgi:hypothetical protein
MPQQGPLPTGTGADDASIGTVTWLSTGNITVDDASYAFATNLNFVVSIVENSIKLVVGGAISGNNKSSGASVPQAEAYMVYGTSLDTWGLSLSVAQVNNSNFGVVFSFKDPTTSTTTHYLKATNFSFAVPAGSTVVGVVMEIKIVFDDLNSNINVNFVRGTVFYNGPGGPGQASLLAGQVVVVVVRGQVPTY